ncbi:hypothetical protein H1Z61_02445 [Bacillus aquiflavi]|uniref:Uncharacterized protein n=1 Tax=Bacillus aquiflavi TaxID=2672567 RepID=A0A6B3VXW1_9BACI|nr:hypothetical protein [Bacillus aquiflavi]MBA4536027.1 hypothetical protein [Bacillus aquiflavi]NEY80401.1 hypothetical protein [Bacillus aquiflavi]UAC47687.1 hypothetical protein K6959_13795 [Bacillus aquiflavi]
MYPYRSPYPAHGHDSRFFFGGPFFGGLLGGLLGGGLVGAAFARPRPYFPPYPIYGTGFGYPPYGPYPYY